MFWIIGGLIFYYRKEHHMELSDQLEEEPFVSILIPCHNEEDTISETIEGAMALNYSNYEVIAINDCSTDQTEDILRTLTTEYSNLRTITLQQNLGKAKALTYGTLAAKGEIIVTIDADAILDPDALQYIIPHFTTQNNAEQVGAVTGNPRIRNRSSLLAKIQLVEYASIIGMIKRTHRILGKLMTVSGVIAAFRKRALLDVDFWDPDLVTDDIGITWKLQRNNWDVRYEPRAICWMLVPETLRGLVKQRIRWAQGGVEVLIRHADIFKHISQRRLYPVYLEQTLSILWSFVWLFYLLYLFTFNFNLILFLFGAYLALISLCQLTISLYLDRQYEKTSMKYILWAAWYPLFYWTINVLVLIPAIPKACKLIFRDKNHKATWTSPDRGL
ncbi:MAG: poly-beta-1,6 N-acetyl-D-glucosamine synthase [Bacillus sp. (in: Bacteria)]|nr:poly-beta-1,6 N-acetyl-D-glucosamine synthase [Bacillus sp. (in: firmicutes)]